MTDWKCPHTRQTCHNCGKIIKTDNAYEKQQVTISRTSWYGNKESNHTEIGLRVWCSKECKVAAEL